MFVRKLSPLSSSQINGITNRYRKRLASLLAVDDLVERVVMRLDTTGVLDNTVLIFTSDNGYFEGEHRLFNRKFHGYEEAVRVPLLIRGGGFPDGVNATQFVANIDLAPTIVQLADADPLRVMDGRPLLPLALNSNSGRGRDLLVETLQYQAVRNESFLYVEHTTGERELYDMRNGAANNDPHQLRSRHADSSYNQIKAQLATKLNQLRSCAGASCSAP